MATNPWTNFHAPATGATATKNANNRARNARKTTKPTGNPPTYLSLWRSPTQPLDNAVTRALERVGGNAVTNAALPAGPGNPGSGNRSGGGGRGGGGGGGGAPGINQAMIDAMAQALGAQGPQLGYTPLPAFQGQALGAFNAAPYDTQRANVNAAAARDRANFATNQAATTQAVKGAYTNPYANAQVQSGPAAPVIGGGLMATAGGTVDPNAANQVNQANAANQGTFQDLYGILSANSQQAQNSRMGQVAMDANYGRQGLEAQTMGLQGGIANQQSQAQNAWQQQAAERDYQNRLMAYQTQMQNAQGQQATNQANWTQQNATLQARLQPILDLISQSAGTTGLNFGPLQAILQRLGAQG